MYQIKTTLTPDLYQKILQKKENTGFGISTIIKLALIDYLQEPKAVGRPLKDIKIKETEEEKINRVIAEWLSEDPNRTIVYNKDERIITVTKNNFIRPFNVVDFLSAR